MYAGVQGGKAKGTIELVEEEEEGLRASNYIKSMYVNISAYVKEREMRESS